MEETPMTLEEGCEEARLRGLGLRPAQPEDFDQVDIADLIWRVLAITHPDEQRPARGSDAFVQWQREMEKERATMFEAFEAGLLGKPFVLKVSAMH